MGVRTITAEDARAEMRTILDNTMIGGEVIIERYKKPTAVIISYEQWQQMRTAWLEKLDRLAAEAHADSVPFEEVQAELERRWAEEDRATAKAQAA